MKGINKDMSRKVTKLHNFQPLLMKLQPSISSRTEEVWS